MTACSTVVVQQPPAGATPRPRAQGAGAIGSYTVVKGDTLYSIAFRNGTDFRDLAQANGISAPYTIWPGQVLKVPPRGGVPMHAPTTVVVAKAPPPAPNPGFQPVESSPRPPASAHAATAAPAVVAANSAAPAALAPPSAPPPVATPVVASGATRVVGGVKWRWPASGQIVGRFQASAAIPGIDIAGKEGDPVVAAADGVVVYSGNGLVGYGELIIIKHNDSFLSAYGHNRKRLVTEGQQVKAGQEIAEMGSSSSPRDELQFQIRKDGSPVDPLDYLPSR
ncbi:MAG TPA: peptidoglycan DD-metalloendopeptidase family protein [Dyella sp.]|uniref:peptidoglycan DD-metalloendopeptidase family protein n=1 Tax=Dyella sp. TaxID=1869338 RepID=UPI002C9D524B|nr:peptidoglycan DD-metalloendopeptidase family protein [Dyella sp.]HTV83993.1 peptidoglycan DD-metalloendopeptidase family protein [Dyella sp.]